MKAALAVVLLAALAWAPREALADEPQASTNDTSRACSTDLTCKGEAADDGGVRTGSRVIPSRPAQVAEGYGDQSSPVLAILGLLGVAGLVVSSLYHLSRED